MGIYIKSTSAHIGILFFFLFPLYVEVGRANETIDDIYVLEDIIVSARKKTEFSQQTPISISSLTQGQLNRYRYHTLDQIAESTPNLNLNFTAPISGSSNALVAHIRGVGQTEFLMTSDPGVAVYLDGVYLARSFGSIVNLYDASQIDILRGPQGTLFGRNAIGGTVNIQSQKPKPHYELKSELATGNYIEHDVRFSINFPLAQENLFARFSGVLSQHNGFGNRILDSKKLGGRDAKLVKGALRWFVDDNFEINATGDYNQSNDDSPVTTLGFLSGSTGNLTELYNLVASPGNDLTEFGFGTGIPYDERFLTKNSFDSFATGPSGSELDSGGLSVEMNVLADDYSIKSITGYRSFNTEIGRDSDNSPITILHAVEHAKHEQLSQELIFQSNSG